MKIGIIGSGGIGGSLGRLWAAAGHQVFFSSRNPDQLHDLASKAGANASYGRVEEAIAFSDLLLEAIPFAAAMRLPAEDYAGKVIINASNYYPHRDGEIDLGVLSQSEAFAARLPGARVVKAFNMMFAEEMAARADGKTEERLAILYAGDDAAAKRIAAQLIEEAIFAPVDAGGLANGVYFENGGPLYAKRMSADTARESLAQHIGGPV